MSWAPTRLEAGRLAVVSYVQTWAHDRHVPLNATVELSQRCNIRCTHCYNFDRDLPRQDSSCASGSPELDRQEILQLLSDLREAGTLFLGLTGGEVLLHPDLFLFLDHARDLNLAVSLLSNGVLLRPGMVAQLARYPNLTRVAVSLYGATAGIHDAITQSPGSFERTWSGSRRLHDQGMGVLLKFIIMRQNAHEVEHMMAMAEASGMPWGVDPIITARHDGSRGSLDNRIDLVQLGALYRGPLRRFLPRGQARTVTDEQFACNCARGNCAITSQGDVQPCMSVPLAAGNIRQQPFAEIWRHAPLFQQIRGLRIADHPECAPCPHKAWCARDRGACVTWSGSYTGIDPLVCARAELAHELAGAPVPERPAP
jgi:radical SAM protein with 4Fe4S-binding SPASM domain